MFQASVQVDYQLRKILVDSPYSLLGMLRSLHHLLATALRVSIRSVEGRSMLKV